MCNTRTGTESINSCIASCHVFKKMYQSLGVIHLVREFSFVNGKPTIALFLAGAIVRASHRCNHQSHCKQNFKRYRAFVLLLGKKVVQ